MRSVGPLPRGMLACAIAALTVLVVQGGIAATASLLAGVLDEATILAITAAGGIILLGVGLRLLDLKAVRVANFLPALILVFAVLLMVLMPLMNGKSPHITVHPEQVEFGLTEIQGLDGQVDEVLRTLEH